MAIDRVDSASAESKKQTTDEATPVAAIVDRKKKSLVSKKNAKKAPAKKKPAAKKSPAKKKAPAKPKAPKTEREWISFVEKSSFSDLKALLESKGGKLNVMAMNAVNQQMNALLKLTAAVPTDYNGWLEYFSDMTRDETEEFMETHKLTLDNEAVAAGKRWLMIYENPALIDRIVQGRLQQQKSEEIGSILVAAKSRDRIQTFEALRDNIAYKLEDGTGARDMTVMIKQLNEVMSTLDELYREAGVKDDQNSSIRKLLVKSRKLASRPRASQAAQTIDDVESMEDDD